MNLAQILEQLKNVHTEPAVSLFIPTHRTTPENTQDPIVLKNELRTLEERLMGQYDKRAVHDLISHIHQQTDLLDHHYNLDTLCIFATPDQATVVRLPYPVSPRTIIDSQFATRDLIRGLSELVHYDILALSRDRARLIEAINNDLLQEYVHSNPPEPLQFPVENSSAHTGGGHRDEAMAEQQHLNDFLHQTDRALQKIRGGHARPVVLVGDHRNTSAFKNITTTPHMIIGEVNGVADNESASHLVEAVQAVLAGYRQQQYSDASDDIGKAIGAGLLSTDLGGMLAGATEGRIDHLYVARGYVQPGQLNSGTLQIIPGPADGAVPEGFEACDDVINYIIEQTMQNGGTVDFIPPENLPEGTAIAAKLRY